MIADITDALYDLLDDLGDGEGLALHRRDPGTYAGQAQYHADINAARIAQGALSYDGVLTEATYAALVEADPDLKTDALIRLAATALAFAGQVQEQAHPADDGE